MASAGAGPGMDEESLTVPMIVISLLCAALAGIIIGVGMVVYLVHEGLVVLS